MLSNQVHKTCFSSLGEDMIHWDLLDTKSLTASACGRNFPYSQEHQNCNANNHFHTKVRSLTWKKDPCNCML